MEDLCTSSDNEGDDSKNNDGDCDDSDLSDTEALFRSEAVVRAKAESRARRKTEKAELKRLTGKRKQKEVKLNRLSSISGIGGNAKRLSKGDISECFICGQTGHLKEDCPNRR